MGVYDELTEISCEILYRAQREQGHGSKRELTWADTHDGTSLAIEANLSAPLVAVRYIFALELSIDAVDVGVSQVRYEPSTSLPAEDGLAQYMLEQFELYKNEVLHAG